jgi:hypothetical protein
MYSSSNPLHLLRYAWRDASRWASRSWKTASLTLATILAILYLAIAFIPLPDPITPGANTAWQYRLSQLDLNGAIFGRDAVSLYGSLGYWLRGAIVGDNFDTVFVVRLSVHLLLMVVALLKLSRLNDPFTRMILAISLLFPYTIAEIDPALQTESQIIFIGLLLLSLPELWADHKRYWPIGLGAATGILVNANASIGIAAITSLMLFLLVRGGQRWQVAPQFETATDIVLQLIETVLAFGALAFLSLAPGSGDLVWRLLIVIGVSVTIGYGLMPRFVRRATWIYGLFPKLGQFVQRLDRTADRAHNALAELGACLVFGVGLIYLAYYTEPSLLAYLRGYLELTLGNSSALTQAPSEAIVGFSGYLQGYIAALTDQLDRLPASLKYGGSALELRLVLLESIGLWLAIAIAVPLGNPAVAIAIFPIFFALVDRSLTVRSDDVLTFIFTLPFLLAIVISTWKSPRLRRVGSVVHLLTLIFCLCSYAYYVSVEDYPTDRLRVFAPDRVRIKAGALLNPQRLQDSLEQKSAASLAPLQFPADLRQAIGDRRVEVLPHETTIIAANHLNWSPLPVVPTRLAYTQYLDRLNRDALQNNPHDLLLYHFDPTDGYHPFFDAPATFFQLWCTYEMAPDLPAPLIPEAEADSPLADLLALTPRDRDRCRPPEIERSLSVSWNQRTSITTPQGAIVRAVVHLRYTLWGTLLNHLFRVPPVQLTLWNSAGETSTYRVLPGNATSGILLSPFPQTQREIEPWFRGEFPDRMYGFAFSTSNPRLFTPTIQVTLQTLQPTDVLDRRLSNIPFSPIAKND